MRQTAAVRERQSSGTWWLGHALGKSRHNEVAADLPLRKPRRDLWPRMLLGATLAWVLALQAAWLVLDNTPMSFVDSYAYLLRLLQMMHALGEADRLGEFIHGFESLSLNGRPPLYQLFAAPALAILGKTEDVAAAINMLFLALGGVALYRLGSLAGSKWAGVLATLIFLTYPPVVAINHEFLPHAIVPTLIVTTLWNLAVIGCRSYGMPTNDPSSRGAPSCQIPPSATGIWLLVIQVTLGALIHPSYLGMVSMPVAAVFVLCVGPGLWARVRMAPAKGPLRLAAILADRSLWGAWLPAGLVGSATVATWYLGPGAVIIEKYSGFKSEALVIFRRQQYLADGFRDQAGPWWFFDTAAAALSSPLAILGAVAVVWTLFGVLLGLLRARSRRPWRALGPRVLVLLSFIWIVAVVYVGETAFAWWKMAPALPLLALLSALTVFDVPAVSLRRAVCSGIAIVCVFNLAFVLFGGSGDARPGGAGAVVRFDEVARSLGARLDSATCLRTARHACVYCPQPPRQEQWPEEAFVAAVRKQTDTVTDTDPGNNEIMIVGGPLIRPALFSFWLAKHWPEHGYRIRGTGYMNWGYPYNLRALLESRFILFAPQPVRKRDTAYVPITLRLLMKPPATFARAHREVATLPIRVDAVYRNVTELRLLRRVEELTLAEAQEVIERLDLPSQYLPQAPKLLEEIRTGDRVHLRGRRR